MHSHQQLKPSTHTHAATGSAVSQRSEIRHALRGAQAKLAIGQADDVYEHEADHIADQIVGRNVASAAIQRSYSADDINVQTKSAGTAPLEADFVLPQGGAPLPLSLRAAYESRFGRDFSAVRVHVGPEAERSAAAINARAYTLGHDIVFNRDQYAPDNQSGQHLLAHELTHVAQQGRAPVRSPESAASPITTTANCNAVQRDLLDAAGFAIRQGFEQGTDAPSRGTDAVALIFDGVVASNIAVATEIEIPDAWRAAVIEYARTNFIDGLVLIAALGRAPSYYRGGWIMDLQPNAGAMTLDHSIFVPDGSDLSLKTYVHELVHVTQYGALGSTAFLTSYFGSSAATIAYRWLRRLPLSPMRSSPHEEQAYQLADRFASWYTSARGTDPRSVTV